MAAIFACWLAVQVLMLVKIGDGQPGMVDRISTALYEWNLIGNHPCEEADVIQTTTFSSRQYQQQCAEFCETLREAKFLEIRPRSGACNCKRRCTPSPEFWEDNPLVFERIKKRKTKATKAPAEDRKSCGDGEASSSSVEMMMASSETSSAQAGDVANEESPGQAASSNVEAMASNEASSAQDDVKNEESPTQNKDDEK